MYPINEAATVKATSSIIIHADRKTVWHLLTDINNWPQWYGDVSGIRFHGEIAEGMLFTWKCGGMNIRSDIRHVIAEEGLFAWTGRIWWITGIHSWRIRSLRPDETEVTSRESLEGFLIAWLFPDEKLRHQLDRWLLALKTAAEAG